MVGQGGSHDSGDIWRGRLGKLLGVTHIRAGRCQPASWDEEVSGHQRRVRLVGTLLLLCSGTVSSHEPGVGRAVVTFPSSRDYVVDLTVDAASLLARLERLARQPLSGAQTGRECAIRIAGLRRELAKHVVVRVDGMKKPVVVDSVEEAPDTSTSAEYALAPE